MERKNKITYEEHMNKVLLSVGDDIIKQGGLLSWASYGCRLGFFDNITDCSETIEGLIQLYIDTEKYELADKFQKEYNLHILPNL